MNIENICTCPTASDDPNCVLHGEAVQFAGVPDLQELFGTRAVPNMPVAAPMPAPNGATGRIVDGGRVTLRPYQPKEDAFPQQIVSDFLLREQPATSIKVVPACRCDLPTLYGHDTGCELHPAPILADPLQMLVAAAQLISDQPTTEQWKTIKKAIRDLVPSP